MFSRTLKEIATEAPVAIAAGIGNYQVAKKETPTVVTTKPAPMEWWVSAGMFALGIAGKVFDKPAWDEVLEPAAAVGLADATELGIRWYKNRSATSTATAQAEAERAAAENLARAQALHRQTAGVVEI